MSYKDVIVFVFFSTAMLGCTSSDLGPPGSTPSHHAEQKPKETSSLEVMHWLATSGEAKALFTIRDAFIARGGTWVDTPMPNVSAANSASIARILGGQGPDAFQVSVGTRLQRLARHGLVAPIEPRVNLDEKLPTRIAEAAKWNGQYVAIPINIHGENWMFFNKRVLASAGKRLPQSWPELLDTARALKARGTTPIALGGQAWQERILFNSVLLGTGGPDLYKRVYFQRDELAMNAPEFIEAFKLFSSLREFVDRGSPGRSWSEATRMVIDGSAAFQFIGDWAKTEITSAGMQPGQEIGCALAPAIKPAYIMAVEAFAIPSSHKRTAAVGTKLFVDVLLDLNVQSEFNRLRGSIPARLDASEEGFDECGRIAMRVVKDPSAQLISTGLSGLSGGMSGAVDDAVSHFWNSPAMSAQEGRRLFRDTVLAFKL